MKNTVGRMTFAALVAISLGFGGTQAIAAPGAPAANSCTFLECRNYCRNEWCLPGRTCSSYCDPDYGCVCYEV